jgi:hypothetical protein
MQVTSTTLGVVLALEPPEPNVMRRRPRRPGKPLLGKFVLWRLLFVTTLLTAAILGNMQWELAVGGSLARGRTVATVNLIICQCVYCVSCRFLTAPATKPSAWWSNPWVPAAVLFDVGVACLVTYTPGLQDVFHTAGLDGLAWLRILMFAAVVFVLVEMEKALGPRYVTPRVVPIIKAVSARTGRAKRALCSSVCRRGTCRDAAGAEGGAPQLELVATATGSTEGAGTGAQLLGEGEVELAVMEAGRAPEQEAVSIEERVAAA